MDAKQVWRAVLGELQVSLSPANFETWLKDTSLVEFDENRFRIAAPNGFARDWLDNRYRTLISQTLARVVGGSVQVEFVVADAPGPVPTQADEESLPLPPASAGGNSVNLNSRYAFTNFIVGSANRLAHAAALSVAERPGHAYNPLFLYGGVGLGKTHLMHAIGNAVAAKFPRKRILYATSEKFTNDFINSIREQKMEDFRNRYRRIDVLLIDDIQFIAEQGAHTGGVLPHLQHDSRGRQADRALLRSATQGHHHPRGAAAQSLRVGTHRGPDAAGPRDAHRDPAQQGRRAGQLDPVGGDRVHCAQGGQQRA